MSTHQPPVVLADLAAQVAANTTIEASAAAFITGVPVLMQAAVDKALENGATAQELAPVTDEIAAMKLSADALQAAIVANTPGAPPDAVARAKRIVRPR